MRTVLVPVDNNLPLAGVALDKVDGKSRTDRVYHQLRDRLMRGIFKPHQRLRDGIDAQAKAHGVTLQQSGPVQMPVILFDDDADRKKGWLFCSEALKRGVYMHATHTLFLSAAHTAADIDRTLDATDAAMAEVARQFG